MARAARKPIEEPGPPGPFEFEITVGMLVVHPAHGAGRVESIEERSFGGAPTTVYVLQILGTGLKVMVPRDAAARVGLRPVMSATEADEILHVLRSREIAVTVQPWNRRFRAYTEMLASGSPHEVAKVLRDMSRLRMDKDLSFGERKLLDQARSLLAQELALAQGVTGEEMADKIESLFSPLSATAVPQGTAP